ncbi:MAG: TonB-dependent receptor [Burkholderiales bacterium]|nr:TonB-dependent receptor [Burkholderiales bacterium]
MRSLHRLRLSAWPLALAAACPSFAQTSLNPVTVTATRFAEPVESLPLGVSIITAEEVRKSGATTVTEALMRLAGVPGRQDFYGGGEYNLDLRGFGATADSNQVVILDGQRLSEADLGGTRLAGIPIDAVERIEILRGGGAVLYGEGATGGVIVITTKAGAGKDRRNAASGYLAAGSYNLRDARATATLAGGGFSLDAGAQRRTTDNHRDNFRSALDTASLTGQWANQWLRLGASYATDDLDIRLPGGISQAQYDANPRQTNRPNDWAQLRNERGTVFAQAEWGDWQVAADAGQRQRTLRSMNSGFAFDYDIDADTWSLRARHEASFGGVKNRVVFGYDDAKWRRDILGAFGSTATQHSQAWYVKDDVTLAGGTRLAAGWRSEDIAKDSSGLPLADGEHAWELGVSHPFGHGITAYARTGRSFRLANVDEFSFTTPGVALEPQTSRDHELGVRWVHAAGRAEARLYRSDVTNEIGFDPAAPSGFGFLGVNTNFDPARRQGLELDVVHAVTKAVGLRLNAALRSSTFRSGPYAGLDVPLAPRRSVALRADWAPAGGHRVSGGVNWVSSQFVDFDNRCTVPSYSTADMRYAYQWKNAEFSLGVANLFGRKYYTQAFTCVGGTTMSIYPEPGRAFTAAVRASF